MALLGFLYNIFVLIEFFLLVAVIVTFLARYLEVDALKDILKVIYGKNSSTKPVPKTDTKYPTVPSEDQVVKSVELFGKTIPDPFTCLEDLTASVTKKWYKDQKTYADDYFGSIAEINNKIAHEIKEAQKFEVIDAPFHHGDSFFFFKRLRPEHSQFSLFSTNNLNVEAKLIFDSSLLQSHAQSVEGDNRDSVDLGPVASEPSTDRHSQASSHSHVVHGAWVSDDGFKMVVGYAESLTSSVMSLAVRDLKNRRDLPVDHIANCDVRSTSISWLTSRIGFFYTTQQIKSAEDRCHSRVYFHRLGLPQDEDLMIYEHITEASNPQSLSTTITSDGHYLLMEIYKTHGELSANSAYRYVATEHHHPITSSVGNKVYYFDLTKFDGKTVQSLGACFKFIDTFSFRFQYISNIEEDFWFRTNYKAPNYRVVRISLPEFFTNFQTASAEYEHKLLIAWKTCLEWIPERKGNTGFLETVGIAAHTVLVLKYLVHGAHEVLLYDLTSDLMEESQIPVAALPHPPYGTITGPNCNFYSSEIFYQYSDFGDPGSIYRAIVKRDVCSGSIEISFDQLNSTSLPNIDKYQYETRQEFIPASGVGPVSPPVPEVSRMPERRGSTQTAPAPPPVPKVPILLFGSKALFDEYDDHKTKSPCLLYVHSGFGVCTMAKFHLPLLILAKHFNMLIAAVNVQGSGIYGSSFYTAGTKGDKLRSVTDLAHVVKYLCETKKYTTHSQLGLLGGGNGGLLISSLLTSSPSSLAAAVICDGLFDMMRYHQYNRHFLEGVTHHGAASSSSTPPPPRPATPATGDSYSADSTTTSSAAAEAEPYWKESAWYMEYGCAEESAEECERMWYLSPLHTINSEFKKQCACARASKAPTYPAVMLTCSNTSSNTAVSFKHSFKFMAELQHCCNSLDLPAKPLVLRCLDEKDEFVTSVAAMDEIANPFAAISTVNISDTIKVKATDGDASAATSRAATPAESPSSTSGGAVLGSTPHCHDCDDNDLTYTAHSLENVSNIFSFLAVNIGAKCNSLKKGEGESAPRDGEPI